MATERSMMGISLHDHIWSEVICECSEVKDVIAEHWKQKFRKAGHIARFLDNRWTGVIVD